LSIYKEEAIVNITVRTGSSPEIKAIVSGLQEEKCGRDLGNVAGKHMTPVCDVATSRNPEKGRLIHLSFMQHVEAVIEGIARRVAKHMHHQRRDPRIDIG